MKLARLFLAERQLKMRWKSRLYQVQESILVELYFHALYCFTQWCLSFKLNDNAHTALLMLSDISAFYAYSYSTRTKYLAAKYAGYNYINCRNFSPLSSVLHAINQLYTCFSFCSVQNILS